MLLVVIEVNVGHCQYKLGCQKLFWLTVEYIVMRTYRISDVHYCTNMTVNISCMLYISGANGVMPSSPLYSPARSTTYSPASSLRPYSLGSVDPWDHPRTTAQYYPTRTSFHTTPPTRDISDNIRLSMQNTHYSPARRWVAPSYSSKWYHIVHFVITLWITHTVE